MERFLSGAPGTQQGSPGGEAMWPKGKLHYLSYVRPALNDHTEPQTRVAFGSKAQKPNLDQLLFKADSNRLTAKQPLRAMDGTINYSCFFLLYIFRKI